MSLKGSLETVGLAEVLQFLASTAKTGEFRLSGAGGEGCLWFDDGAISGFDAGSSQAPFEAIFELLRFEGGEFDFSAGAGRPDSARVAEGEEGAVGPAIERAQARLEEWREIVSVVPSLSHRAFLATELPCEEVTLRAAQWSMVGTIGSGRVVADLIEERGLSEFDGCKVVKELVDAHLVRVEEPAVAEEPVAEEPVADEPVAEEPVAAEPAGDEPVAEQYAGEAVEDHQPDAWSAAPEASHYDALKAVIAEVGAEAGDEWSSDEVYGVEAVAESRATLEALAAEAASDPYGDGQDAEGFEPDAYRDPYDPDAVETDPYIVGSYGQVDGHDDPGTVHVDRPVDGLADRGPWTAGELAEIGTWDGADTQVAVADGSDEPDAAEGEAQAAEEQPINRGLLLKFLSSVRD